MPGHRKCCLTGCATSGVTTADPVRFFPFPFKDKAKRKRFIEACVYEDQVKFDPNKEAVICSLHFLDVRFIKTNF